MTVKATQLNQPEMKPIKTEPPKEASVDLGINKSIAKAKAIQEQQIADINRRKKAPDSVKFSAYAQQDPITKFTEQHVPEGFTGYTTPDSKLEEAIAKGYTPVLDDHGEHVRAGNDLGFIRPKEITEDQKIQVANRSKARLLAMDGELAASARGIGSIEDEATDVSKG